jgi:hypothetical protein
LLPCLQLVPPLEDGKLRQQEQQQEQDAQQQQQQHMPMET